MKPKIQRMKKMRKSACKKKGAREKGKKWKIVGVKHKLCPWNKLKIAKMVKNAFHGHFSI